MKLVTKQSERVVFTCAGWRFADDDTNDCSCSHYSQINQMPYQLLVWLKFKWVMGPICCCQGESKQSLIHDNVAFAFEKGEKDWFWTLDILTIRWVLQTGSFVWLFNVLFKLSLKQVDKGFKSIFAMGVILNIINIEMGGVLNCQLLFCFIHRKKDIRSILKLITFLQRQTRYNTLDHSI